jgi:hypothetical protein
MYVSLLIIRRALYGGNERSQYIPILVTMISGQGDWYGLFVHILAGNSRNQKNFTILVFSAEVHSIHCLSSPVMREGVPGARSFCMGVFLGVFPKWAEFC